MSLDQDLFRIDAYTASVPEEPTDLVSELVDRFEECGYKGIHLEAFSPRHYEHGVRIRDDAGQLCSVQHGGRNPLPLIDSQGPQSATIASYLRSAYADHTVSRLDSAIDLTAPGLYDQAYPEFVRIARLHGLSKDQAGDWFDPLQGRTLYLGGRKAARRVRLYEKGKKLSGEGHPDADTDHVRCEVQYRPEHAEQKRSAAALAASAVWGTSPWLIECLEAFSGIQAQPVSLRRYRPPDSERTRYWLLMQYGPALKHWADEVGGYEHLGINIDYALRDLDKLTRARAQVRHEKRRKAA